MEKKHMDNRPMLNLYPDSLGGTVESLCQILDREEFADVFSSVYILPSIYHSDLDRGFSVIDYDLEGKYASKESLKRLQKKRTVSET